MDNLHVGEKTIGFRDSSQPAFDAPLTATVDIPKHVSDALHAKGFKVDSAGIVRWAEGSITHPRRWPLLRKMYDTAIICFLEFFMTLVSNTGSSIAPFVADELGIGKQTAVLLLTTVYLTGQGIGGLIFPPIAESFRGRPIYPTSTFGFAVLCLTVTAWPTLQVLVTSRFLTGLLSAMPCVVAAGSIENMWDMKSRTFVIHLWISGAVVGLALGPPIATFVSISVLRW
jgi:MFS family permease